ncbi:unnamed protein product [Cylindrotheca closterium]|uniref:Uncharacterized protein n=1 Tax=Cylindrotheca closterium TaxID=2856 RepID=A0AAD2G4T9_9STRA|nr:unnamed protein product [Cylindrotheca closterium]
MDAGGGTDATAKAEDLRLQGNASFKLQDFERAIHLYEAAIAAASPTAATAKTYSNLAASMCKVGKYDEACKAADRATALDSKWAKGWWRRGTCLELIKDFGQAKNCYTIALEQEPKNKVFKYALKKIHERLGVEDSVNGVPVIPLEAAQHLPVSVKAFWRAQSMVGRRMSCLTMEHHFRMIPDHDVNNPTSCEWLFRGFVQWVKGIKGAIADFARSTAQQSAMAWMQISSRAEQFESQDAYFLECERLLGGLPNGDSMSDSLSGFTHLGGLHIYMTTGPGPSSLAAANGYPPIFSPPLHVRHPMYQVMASLWSIYAPLRYLVDNCGFGRNIKISKGTLSAVNLLFSNLGGAPHGLNIKNMEQDPTPEEMVEYVKRQLKAGKTWDKEMRQFVSLNYRSTVLYAGIFRLIVPAAIAESYKLEKWANRFISLLDNEFRVSATESFEEKGTSFRPSLRVGSLMSQLMSLEILRCDQINGPYSMEMTLDLCVDIIEMANSVGNLDRGIEYDRVQDEVAFRRKPLALANSVIAAHLNRLKTLFSPDEFKGIVLHHGLILDEDADCDPFALIAKHYEIAAENELPDANEGSMYWWGAGAAMAQANPSSGITLGQLRRAIRMAEAAEEARDIDLFGENQQLGGSFESLATITARCYDQESDDFVIPQVNLMPPAEGLSATSYMEVEGTVICKDFDGHKKADNEELIEERNKKHTDRMNTSDVQRKHGQTRQGIQSLETLCIRELHKAGEEFAKGRTDGAEIIYNAMVSESKSSET